MIRFVSKNHRGLSFMVYYRYIITGLHVNFRRIIALTVHKLSTLNHYFVLFWPKYSKSRSRFAHQASSTICILYPSWNQFQYSWNGVFLFYRFRDTHISPNFCNFFHTINQKVGHILPTTQVLLYASCSTPETGFNALRMAFLSLTVFEIHTSIGFWQIWQQCDLIFGHWSKIRN